MNNVIAVIVTFNRKKLLTECIESLLIQKYNCDILVIDNASTDGTYEEIRGYIDNKKIKYVNTKRNLGGAGGFQFGIKLAVENLYEYVWIMDDDAMPTPEALNNLMVAKDRLGKFGYLASKVLWKDKTECIMNLQRNLKLKPIHNLKNGLTKVGASTFVSLLIPVTTIREIGLPIKEFFIWADDLEYTRRISLKYPCFVVSNSIVIHKSATNNGANIATDLPERVNRYSYAYRNEVYVYKREGFKGVFHILLRTPFHILKVLCRAKSMKCKRIYIIMVNTFKGIYFNPEIEYI